MPNKTTILAWCSYDWANSAFFSNILTFVFASIFINHIAANPIIGTQQWGFTVGLAGLGVALMGPVLGYLSDKFNIHKLSLILFTLLGIILTALLGDKSSLVYLGFAILFLELAIVFYNSLLPKLIDKAYYGRVSSWAWGLGYLGGLTSLILYFFVKNYLSIGFYTALWILLFSLPVFYFIKQPEKQINKTKIKFTKNIILFLISRLLYNEGLTTLFVFGGIFAAGSFGLNLKEILVFGIVLNLTAALGAFLFAKWDDILGPKKIILINLFCLIVITGLILLNKNIVLFWVLGSLLGLFIGPIQASSRSLMAHMVPEEQAAGLFGFYALSGKATAFLGPWSVALLTTYFNSQRIGMATILGFLGLGALLLTTVN